MQNDSSKIKSLPFNDLDAMFSHMLAKATGGFAPSVVTDALYDWLTHLAFLPGKQLELAQQAVEGAFKNMVFTGQCIGGSENAPCVWALPQDNRFRPPEWQSYPFNTYAHGFLSMERWWENAMKDIHGMNAHHRDMAIFVTRQWLDMVAPTNYILTNPIVINKTQANMGANLVQGISNLLDDMQRKNEGKKPAGMDAFVVGKTLAITPGKVVHRTQLAEIIQYAPTTEHVRPEPIIIVPAWIMKYYILDLSPHNSMVKYLTDQGFTVFMVSWKNPGTEDRDVNFDDYRTQGVMAAIEAATTITGSKKVHGVGYCLGGTLLAITAAALAHTPEHPFASLSILAGQVDFTEAGELLLFISESQIAFLEDVMAEKGYLEAEQMVGAFQFLRSNDLIWSRIVHDYLMGERTAPNDLMAWNADATRMPATMHSQYLRSLFMNNDLTEGRFKADGHAIAIDDIHTPIFAVSTVRDHISPWHSVFKIQLLADADTTFVLTSGGHNAGIVSEPGHPRRSFRMATHIHGTPYVDPEQWYADNAPQDGSWWPAWSAWLAAKSGAPVAPPPMGKVGGAFAPIADAPGEYVLMK